MTKQQDNSSLRPRILFTAILLFAVCACAIVINVRAKLKDDSVNAAVRNDAEARVAFLEAYKVFMHPRCVNCHPAGDAPLQGEDSRPHGFFRLRRGVDGQGVFTLKCINCHQIKNQDGPHMPPGTPFPLKGEVEDPAHRGEPRWHLPPEAMRMVFEKRSPGQLCSQLLDKKKNGGLTVEALVDHVDHDPFVLWAWNPGEGRSSPSLRHEEFVSKVRDWVNKGAACPK